MKLGTTGFFSNRIFPTEGLGETEAGWHYVYPVHEVSALHTFSSLTLTVGDFAYHACHGYYQHCRHCE